MKETTETILTIVIVGLLVFIPLGFILYYSNINQKCNDFCLNYPNTTKSCMEDCKILDFKEIIENGNI